MSPGDLLPVPLATDATLAVLLEGSLLLGATWGVAALLRRHAPAVRHTVWTTGLVLALLVPAAGALLPVRSLGLLPYPPPLPGSAGGGAPPSRGLDAAAPFPDLPAPGPGAELPDGLAVTGVPTAGPGFEQLGTALATAFLVFWALGALLMLGRLVGHRVHVDRLTRRGTPAPPGDTPARLVRLEARRMGIRRRVRVAYTSELAVPVTWGIVRPVLLLPPDAATWDDTRLRAVVVHELAHVRRWDALSQQLAELARALYWANPLVWIARRLAAAERESACDDEVLRGGMAPSEYAGILVEMARRSMGSPPGLRQELEGGLALAGSSRLEARVSAVLERSPEDQRYGRSTTLASCLALTLVAAPLAGMSIMAETPEPPAEPPSLHTRLQMVRALGVECDEVSLWTLTRALQEDPAIRVRTAAAHALATHDDPRTVDVLAHATADRRQAPEVRRAAIQALGRRDSRGAAEALVTRLHDADRDLRRAAVHAMAGMELQSRRIRGPLAMAMLEDPDPSVRAAAAAALQRVGCDDSLRRLRKALEDPSPVVGRTAKRTLERLGAR